MATQRDNPEPQTSYPTEALNGLLHHNRQELLDRMIQAQVTGPGSQHPSKTESVRREFANEIIEALLTAMGPVTDNYLTLEDAQTVGKPTLARIAIQARNYRHLGTSLSSFLSVIKGMRRILKDFMTRSPSDVSLLYPAVSLIDRFFDALELEIIDDWRDNTGTPAERHWRVTSQALIDQIGTYQLAFSHSPIPILIVDAAALVVNMNPAAARFWQLVGNSTGSKLVGPDRPVPWLNPELETFLASPQDHYQFDKIIGHPALFIHVRVNCQRLTTSEGINSGAVIIVHNTTESHRLEEALRAEREQFFQLLEQLPASVYLLSQEKEIVFANREFRNNFGDIDHRSCFEAIHGLESQCPDCPALKVLETGQPVIWEKTYADQRTFEIYNYPFFDAANQPHVLGLMTDRTHHREMENSLKWYNNVNAGVADMARGLIESKGVDDIDTQVLERAMSLTGSSHGFIGRIAPGSDLVDATIISTGGSSHSPLHQHSMKVHPRDLGVIWGWVLQHRNSILTNHPETDHRFLQAPLPEGHIQLERFLSVPATHGSNLLGFIALANPDQDYSERHLKLTRKLATLYALALERRQAEDQLSVLLQEKEILLKEIHHRIKNNLQVVCSLLNIQSSSLECPADIQMFRESQARLKSMALIHEMLYHTDQNTAINFKHYLSRLIAYLQTSLGLEADQCHFELEIAEITFDINTAIPLGLIINELVSNAFKYAFPDRSMGHIKITLCPLPDGHHQLTVSDDGIGIPHDLDLLNSPTMGMQLVKALVRQLNGRIDISNTRGTTIVLTFAERFGKRE